MTESSTSSSYEISKPIISVNCSNFSFNLDKILPDSDTDTAVAV